MAKPQRTTAQIPLVGGLDQKTAPDLVQPGSFLEVENCWRDRTGEFRKRYGSAVLGSTTTFGGSLAAVTGPQFLAKERSGLLRLDIGRTGTLGDTATYSSSSGRWAPLDASGFDASVLPATIAAVPSALDRSLPDAAAASGLVVVAHELESGTDVVECM